MIFKDIYLKSKIFVIHYLAFSMLKNFVTLLHATCELRSACMLLITRMQQPMGVSCNSGFCCRCLACSTDLPLRRVQQSNANRLACHPGLPARQSDLLTHCSLLQRMQQERLVCNTAESGS